MFDQHGERSAPVAYVIASDDVVPCESIHSRERVTDDRGTKVAPVHLLGDVGSRVVDHHRFHGQYRLDSEASIMTNITELTAEEIGYQGQIDESRPGNLGRRDVGQIGSADDLLGDVARSASEALGGGHDAVGLG